MTIAAILRDKAAAGGAEINIDATADPYAN